MSVHRVIVNTEIQDFKEIKDFLGFVDHTCFIHSFLSTGSRRIAIFAPRRFGKSSHLDMVKRFLEVHLDKNGKPDPTVNRQIFENTEIIKNPKCKITVEQHMGKHPVIHVDFKCGGLICLDDVVTHCRYLVHKAYVEHNYLVHSQKLCPDCTSQNASIQLDCLEWCDVIKYKEKSVHDIKVGLIQLARYLHSHHGTQVYLLIDEFDAVYSSAIHGIEAKMAQTERKDHLVAISGFLAHMLTGLVKGNHDVGGALITGISYVVTGLGFSPLLNNLTILRFLDDMKVSEEDVGVVAFYGGSEQEVRSVVRKLIKGGYLDKQLKRQPMCIKEGGELDEDEIMRVIDSNYNGYYDRGGRRIYSLWSVLQFLASGKADYYWKATDGINCFYPIFKSGSIGDGICRLIRGECIKFTYLKKLQVDDILQLYELLGNRETDNANENIVFSFLMDQGFISYTEGIVPESESQFKIPNVEIQLLLAEMMDEFATTVWKFRPSQLKNCAKTIDEISISVMENEDELKKKMLKLHKYLAELLKGFKLFGEPFQVNECALMCIMYAVLAQSILFKFAAPDSQIKSDNNKSVSSGRPDLFTKHKTEKFAILWEFKHNIGTQIQKMKTSAYALREARGENLTTNNTRKDYIRGLDQIGIEKFLVIGLSMDGQCEISLAYAAKDDKKIFFISKSEYDTHKKFYDSVSAFRITDEGTSRAMWNF